MIQQVWDKKVIVQIHIEPKDVADEYLPLPLFLQIPWNHYIGLYFDQIIVFFSSYTVYPWNKDEFHLKLIKNNLTLNGTEIIGHLVTLFNQGIDRPISLQCHFRNKSALQTIQMKKFFKYSLKASTAIRNQKLGASILTLQMSIQNVDNLFQSFKSNDLKSYLGSNGSESGNIGLSFIISKTQRVPVKIMAEDFMIERGVDKETLLSQFLANIFEQTLLDRQKQQISSEHNIKSNESQNSQGNQNLATIQDQVSNKEVRKQNYQKSKQKKIIMEAIKYNYLFQKYSFYMHGVKITRGEYPMEFFQRFCHPDGFLYIFFKQTN